MNKCISVLFVIVMVAGALVTAVATPHMDEPDVEHPIGLKMDKSDQSSSSASVEESDGSKLGYPKGLEPSGREPTDPSSPNGPDPSNAASRVGDPPLPDVILLYENPLERGQWLPLPTKDDIIARSVPPVSFENRSWLEVHGKLYERPGGNNITHFDDIGIPDVPINITFDGVLIPGGIDLSTGNRSTYTEPFGVNGNGTFQFLIFIDKPAGRYEIGIDFDGWPRDPNPVIMPRYYKVEIYVNHPSIITMDELARSYVVGEDMQISGRLSDDTRRRIDRVPLQIWFDEELIGPTSDGVYIDDVNVHGTGYFDNFESQGTGGWSTYSAPTTGVDTQWESGSPGQGHGPPSAYSGSMLWGTVLDDDYQRGALSYLVTPPFDLTEDRSYTLSFWAWWKLHWYDDLAYVVASTDGGTTWDDTDPMSFTEDGLSSTGWTLCLYNVTEYQGSDDVRFAFVFYSIDKSLEVGPDSSFEYTHNIPMNTTAEGHELTVIFDGNLLYEESQHKMSFDIKRIVHFEFEQNASNKVCYRNRPVELVVWLKDNEGEVLTTNIDGYPNNYGVYAYWNGTQRIGGRIGFISPSGYVDPETGRCPIPYVVSNDHYLGPVNVTFKFLGDDHYTLARQTDVYLVKANVYFRFPDDEDFRRLRGQSIEISAELRTVPGQSIIDGVHGDPLRGEDIEIYWNGQKIGNRWSGPDGSYTIGHTIPVTHSLGDVLVRFVFEGNSLNGPFTRYVNYTVGSLTFISVKDSTAVKGDWITIRGSVKDDVGQPVPFVQVYIIWKRAPEIARATTRSDGTFSVPHLKLHGPLPGPTAHSQCNTSFSTRIGPEMSPSSHDSMETGPTRRQYRTRRGSSRSIPSSNVATNPATYFEDSMSIDGVVVESKTTSYDGRVTFTRPIDPAVYSFGMHTLLMTFEGSEFYIGTTSKTTIFFQFLGWVTFSDFDVNSRPFNLSEGLLKKDDAINGRVLVVDEDGSPQPGKKVSIQYFENPFGAGWVEIATGRTDSEGYFEFQFIIRVIKGGNLTFTAECEVLMEGTGPRFSVRYIVPPPPTDEPIISTSGSRQTAIGDRLTLDVRVRDNEGWNVDDLVFHLVSPPDGMTISSEGTITWTPTGDQVGTHNITVWVFDGSRSETTILMITVVEGGNGLGALGWAGVIIFVFLLIAGIAIIQHRRNGHVHD